MKTQVKMKRFATAVIMAWIIFIGIDFLFHASIFAFLWKENISVFKSTEDLTKLIPFGYFSFLLLTLLIGYLFVRVFKIKPALTKVLKFGSIFGLLFSSSNFLGLYSYLAIPPDRLLLFSLISFIEIIFVTLSLYFTLFAVNLKRVIWYTILCSVLLLIGGIVIQNIFR
ncbi:MAG: hypothetical protein WC171_07485 [Bacteroidales bacterium]|jgi:hypothetical protein